MHQTHLATLLEYFGLDELDTRVFVAVYQYGPKPASSLANILWLERTHVYKLLKKLVGVGLVSETQINKTKNFFIADNSVLETIVNKKQKELSYVEKKLTAAQEELTSLKQHCSSFVPKISVYDGYSGVENIFEDMIQTIQASDLRIIKFFGSNTVESQTQTTHRLTDYADNFFAFCKDNKIWLDSYIGNGIMMMEMLQKVNKKDLQKLPAGQDAINTFIVGTTIYLIIYKTIPFGIKIQSKEIADMMHLFWKELGK